MESTSHKDYVVKLRSPKCIEKEDKRYDDPIERSMPRSPSQIYQKTTKKTGGPRSGGDGRVSMAATGMPAVVSVRRKAVAGVPVGTRQRWGCEPGNKKL